MLFESEVEFSRILVPSPIILANKSLSQQSPMISPKRIFFLSGIRGDEFFHVGCMGIPAGTCGGRSRSARVDEAVVFQDAAVKPSPFRERAVGNRARRFTGVVPIFL